MRVYVYKYTHILEHCCNKAFAKAFHCIKGCKPIGNKGNFNTAHIFVAKQL